MMANEKPTKKEETKVSEEQQEEVAPQEKKQPKDFYKLNSNEENLTNFDWYSYESGVEGFSMTDDERKSITDIYSEKVPVTEEKDILKGVIIRKTDKEVIVDINGKSEGVISLNELRYNSDIKEGEEIDVVISNQEDKKGQLVLSHKRARTLNAWNKVNEALETGEILNGLIKSRTRGGMIADVLGIETFLPGSQIDVNQIEDYDQYIGKTMDLKVVKINPEFNNVVVSHKAIIEDDIREQKKDIMSKLSKGQVLEGVVKNLTNYGVFVDLGGIDGLVYITDISWNRINQPSDALEVGEKVKVVILEFEEEKNRIQLGIKQLQPHPWEQLDANLKEGDKVKGKVALITDYGAFVEVIPGVEGLVHVSEMSWSTHLRSAQDFVQVGDEIETVVLSIDREERKISLGIKQLTSDPWTDITEKYPVDSIHTGRIMNFTSFGVFVELSEGVEGLVYITDLSWTKKIKHPSEFCKVGDKMEVKVLELDTENRRLSLGHKQLSENPWDKYEEKYKEGSVFEGMVRDIFEKGSSVIFKEDDLDAFCPKRFLIKEDGKSLNKGDNAEFKVIEFSKELKRVIVSHTSVFKEEEENIVRNNRVKMSTNNEKTTLGDLSAISDLKNKIKK